MTATMGAGQAPAHYDLGSSLLEQPDEMGNPASD
jgi:hypothetical protein